MIVEDVGLGDAKLIKLERYEDYRGAYTESFNEDKFEAQVINSVSFVQDDVSYSRKDVLRGLHGDDCTWKLISCPYGTFYFVIVDLNINSNTYGKHKTFILSAENANQVLVPPLFANAHLVLSDECIFSYKQSAYYNRIGQFSIKWNDSDLGIQWPISKPILSYRDNCEAMSFENYDLLVRNGSK